MLQFDTTFSVQKEKILGARNDVSLIGKCEGKSVLLSYTADWDGVVTAVSEYNLDSHQNRVLFKERGAHHISSASLDTSKSLLGVTFRTAEPEGGHTYITRLAEVNPMRRTFRLGEPTWELQKLLFLPTPSDTSSALCHFLLFIHHREIFQYRCQFEIAPDDSRSLSAQPDSSHVADSFAWAEVDLERALLFHATLSPESNRKVRISALRLRDRYASAGEAVEAPGAIFAIDFPLPGPYDMIGGELDYAERYFGHKVSDQCLNLSVCTLDNGTICFCMQLAGLTERDEGRYEYAVFMIHNGHVLHCQVPKPPQPPATPCGAIHFLMCSQLLLAFLPGDGGFLHAVNCSGEFELYHHLVATGTHCPTLPDDSGPLEVSGKWLVDWRQGRAYKPSFDSQGLLRLFRETNCAHNKLAVVHTSQLFLEESDLIPDIIREATRRATQLVAQDIFAEFLLVYPYAAIRKSVLLKIQRSLPVTAASAFYHQLAYREGATLLATFVTSRMAGISGDILDIPEGVSQLLDLAKNNYYIVRFGRSRFSPKAIMQGLLTGDGAVIKVVETLSQQSGTKRKGILGFLASFSKTAPGTAPFTPSPMDEGAITFLTKVSMETQPNLLMSQVLWERLLAYLNPYIIVRENEEGLESIVSRYVSLQHEASRKLLVAIWASLDLQNADPLSTPLLGPAPQESAQLFHALEKYLLTARELAYPLPKGFSSLHCCLAFRHLTAKQFLRQAELQLIQLTDHFYEKMESERVSDHCSHLCRMLAALKDTSPN